MEMTITKRREAREKGLKYYFTGKPCKHGHMSQRRTSTGRCIECERTPTDAKRAATKRWLAKNPDKQQAYHRKYYAKNAEKLQAYHREYYAKNREKLQAYGREYYAKNWEKQQAQKREYYAKNRGKLQAYGREYSREYYAKQKAEGALYELKDALRDDLDQNEQLIRLHNRRKRLNALPRDVLAVVDTLLMLDLGRRRKTHVGVDQAITKQLDEIKRLTM